MLSFNHGAKFILHLNQNQQCQIAIFLLSRFQWLFDPLSIIARNNIPSFLPAAAILNIRTAEKSLPVFFSRLLCYHLSATWTCLPSLLAHPSEPTKMAAASAPSPTEANAPPDVHPPEKEKIDDLQLQSVKSGDSIAYTTDFGFIPIPERLRYNPAKPPHFGLLMNIAFGLGSTFSE